LSGGSTYMSDQVVQVIVVVGILTFFALPLLLEAVVDLATILRDIAKKGDW